MADPVRPLDPLHTSDVAGLLEVMAGCSFQGRSLGRAYQVWRHMVNEAGVIFCGLAGAMVPAGMRQVVVRLIESGCIDCLVTTGANLFHDAYESLGTPHWKGDPQADDAALRALRMDRFYDTYGDDKAMEAVDRLAAAFADGLEPRPHTTREFFYRWGGYLATRTSTDGILTTAYRRRVPIYVPAVADSSYGIALAALTRNDGFFQFDVIRDAHETALIASENSPSGAVYFCGGTPKNFIQQSHVTAELLHQRPSGHRFAIQVTADAPHWGGLSGCTIEESISWGKVTADAEAVNVHADATIALPLLASALLASEGERAARRQRPVFPFEWD